jgi:hypothetical protein
MTEDLSKRPTLVLPRNTYPGRLARRLDRGTPRPFGRDVALGASGGEQS